MSAARSTHHEPSIAGSLVLALAFVAFVVIGVVTVILPELENADEEDPGAAETATGEPPSPSQAPAP